MSRAILVTPRSISACRRSRRTLVDRAGANREQIVNDGLVVGTVVVYWIDGRRHGIAFIARGVSLSFPFLRYSTTVFPPEARRPESFFPLAFLLFHRFACTEHYASIPVVYF